MDINNIFDMIKDQQVIDHRLNHFNSNLQERIKGLIKCVDEYKNLYESMNFDVFKTFIKDTYHIPTNKEDIPYFVSNFEDEIKAYYIRHIQYEFNSVVKEIISFYGIKDTHSLLYILKDKDYFILTITKFIDLIYKTLKIDNINHVRLIQTSEKFHKRFEINIEDNILNICEKNCYWVKRIFYTASSTEKYYLLDPKKMYFNYDDTLEIVIDYIQFLFEKHGISIDFSNYLESACQYKYGQYNKSGYLLPKTIDTEKFKLTLFTEKMQIKLKIPFDANKLTIYEE